MGTGKIISGYSIFIAIRSLALSLWWRHTFSQSFSTVTDHFRRASSLAFVHRLPTIIPLPTGELVVYAFERWARNGDFHGRDIEYSTASILI